MRKIVDFETNNDKEIPLVDILNSMISDIDKKLEGIHLGESHTDDMDYALGVFPKWVVDAFPCYFPVEEN